MNATILWFKITSPFKLFPVFAGNLCFFESGLFHSRIFQWSCLVLFHSRILQLLYISAPHSQSASNHSKFHFCTFENEIYFSDLTRKWSRSVIEITLHCGLAWQSTSTLERQIHSLPRIIQSFIVC